MVVFCLGYGFGIGLYHSCPGCGFGCGLVCVISFGLIHWLAVFSCYLIGLCGCLSPSCGRFFGFFPMPGLWACVISGRFAWFPCLWGLVVVLVIGSSKLRIIWWFYIGLIPLFL